MFSFTEILCIGTRADKIYYSYHCRQLPLNIDIQPGDLLICINKCLEPWYTDNEPLDDNFLMSLLHTKAGSNPPGYCFLVVKTAICHEIDAIKLHRLEMIRASDGKRTNAHLSEVCRGTEDSKHFISNYRLFLLPHAKET